ncbi:UDP-N-acetylbacillosamine N-acetyltransferase [Lachnospiraceae bacterium]|nr:UDP-N-acetylbacillosamine N-acetyltransferase [Lachnospiraceae bacterium]
MVLGIYGSGGCGREARDVADILNHWEEIVYIDDTVETGTFKGLRRMPFELFCQTYKKENAEVIVALGEPEHKNCLYDKVQKRGYQFANIIHPKAWISPSASIGKGVIIKAEVLISCDTKIGNNVGIEAFVSIGHDCVIGENCQISSGVMVGGGSWIGAGTYIGINVPVKENTKIGSNSIVGMGSIVLRDIPENVIALGNPARTMKYKDESKVFG